MKKVSIFMIVALCFAGVVSAQGIAEESQPAGFEAFPEAATVVEDAEPATEYQQVPAALETPDSKACQAKAKVRETTLTPGFESMLTLPTPIPPYCEDCKPCTYQAQCGRDPWSGTYMGICGAPGGSYCGGLSYSACVCF